MKAIDINNLQKVYKNKTYGLTGLSMSIPEGNVFALIGPNGAGKSTLINILAGILRPSGGEVSIFGERIQTGDYEYKRKVGFVLEKPHYISKLSVQDYLKFAATMYQLSAGISRERVEELLDFFDLHEKRDSIIETCSTGMKKKVSLAAAMIQQPRLLILDEPLEGVDPVSSKKIKENFRFMAEKGVTVVLSSHNLDTMEKFCDEIAIIHRGKLLFQTKTEDIHKKIKDELTQETYQSLEEIFIDLVSNNHDEQKPISKLSWL